MDLTKNWIYLDYNASTPMDAEVLKAMEEALRYQAHPSSPHPHGRGANAIIEDAREKVAEALHCQSREVIFNSGSTEASNHVIKGVSYSSSSNGEKKHFITSCVDHAATLAPLRFLEKQGHELTVLGVDKYARIDPADLKKALRAETVLVSLIHGQNEVGSIQPLEKIGAICREHGTLFHIDASQSFGKIPVCVEALQADFLNIAGHKAYGPKGVGALFIRDGLELEPLLHGGGHESGWRSGTPAPQLIAGLGAACELVKKLGFVPPHSAKELWTVLSSELGERITRNGHPEKSLPNVLHVTFQGVDGRTLLNHAKVSASTGAACHSAALSPVLSAMDLTPEQTRGSVRLSCGRGTSLEDAKRAGIALVDAYRALLAEEGSST